MNRRRCLWLTKGLGRGGVERLLVDMLPLVDTERWEIDVAYVLPWKDNFHRELEDRGARVTCLGSGGIGDPRWTVRLRRLMRQRDYDVVHSHSPVPASVARLLRGQRSSPAFVHTEHNVWSRYHWATRLANSATYHRNTAVIAVSDSVAESIEPLVRGRCPQPVTIHHGTVITTIEPWSSEERAKRRAALGVPAGGFVIGMVANLTPKKNHRLMLEAMAGDGAQQRAHLVLVGLGPLEDEIRAAAEELEIADRTTFLGSRDDVPELLPLFDLFVLSSRFEGFPISLVEAMATGLPCVATSVGGIPEVLVDGENGLLVESGDREGLRAAITKLMDDPGLAAVLGQRARATAEQLDLRMAVRAMEALYDSALET
ncbi:MAG: glycosyltransferase [Acidimicrobiia bacterium]|nr:glycosyltransferase [Acidimicrobiia bacterium]